MNGTITVLAVIFASLAIPVWCYRRELAAQLKNPTPGFLRITRPAGRAASIVCGVGCIILIWAGFTVPAVSWLYGLLGLVVLPLNLLLFYPGKRPR